MSSTRTITDIKAESDKHIATLGTLQYNLELQKAQITETVLMINKLHQERHELENPSEQSPTQ